MKINERQWCSVYKAEGGAMRRYIENIIGFVLVGISMLVQMRYIQKTQYLIYAFFIFFAVGMILHTIKNLWEYIYPALHKFAFRTSDNLDVPEFYCGKPTGNHRCCPYSYFYFGCANAS